MPIKDDAAEMLTNKPGTFSKVTTGARPSLLLV